MPLIAFLRTVLFAYASVLVRFSVFLDRSTAVKQSAHSCEATGPQVWNNRPTAVKRSNVKEKSKKRTSEEQLIP